MNRKLRTIITAIVLTCLLCAAPMSALAHGSCHSTSKHCTTKKSGVYCTYHKCRHTKKTACARYCKKHATTHSNGKKHCK